MAQPEYEIPAEWSDELDELRKRVAELPEDDEDRLIRDGEARFAAMSPEEQARLTRLGDEILERMQAPQSHD
jgi:hypothetical protein